MSGPHVNLIFWDLSIQLNASNFYRFFETEAQWRISISVNCISRIEENIRLKQLIDYAYLWVPILGVQGPSWVPMSWKIGSLFGPFKDRLQWMKKRPRSLIRGTHDSIVMSATSFLAFLGHLLFWMGMFKVFRWNGLEILILKHMWKSIMGPLEQI